MEKTLNDLINEILGGSNANDENVKALISLVNQSQQKYETLNSSVQEALEEIKRLRQENSLLRGGLYGTSGSVLAHQSQQQSMQGSKSYDKDGYAPETCALCDGNGEVYSPNHNYRFSDDNAKEALVRGIRNSGGIILKEEMWSVIYATKEKCGGCRGKGSVLVHNSKRICGNCNGNGGKAGEDKGDTSEFYRLYCGKRRRISGGPWLKPCDGCKGSGWAHLK